VHEIDDQLKTLLGLGSRELFDRTVRITQREMTDLKGNKAISDRLQQKVSGGGDDVQVSRVLKKLGDALNDLKRASVTNPGALTALPSALEGKRQEIAARRQIVERADAARVRLEVARTELDRMRIDLASKQDLAAITDRKIRLRPSSSAPARTNRRSIGAWRGYGRSNPKSRPAKRSWRITPRSSRSPTIRCPNSTVITRRASEA
jgi:hypothetical protein